MLVCGCLLFVGIEQASYFASYPGAWLLSIGLLGATAIPAGIIIYVVAVTFSGITNQLTYGFLQHVTTTATVDQWAASLVAPINEELYKGAGLVLLYLMARHEFNGIMDGLVYGAMLGLGFQVVENVQYFMVAAAGSGGAVRAVVDMFYIRVLLAGLYSHMLFTAFFGFGFAYFITQRGKSMRRRAAVLGFGAALAWASHFVWNSPWLDSLMVEGNEGFAAALVIKGMPFLILLALLGVFANHRERYVFSLLMRSEVGSEAVSKGEFYVLQSGHRRAQALRHMRRTKGAAAATVFKRLMREQINLALMHRQVRMSDHPALETQREVIRRLKGRLAEMGS
jgi:RsiW-degrading membrane proteinase PrsW (M82 family)